MIKNAFRFLALLCLLCFSSMVMAHSYRLGDIHIGHIWTRATPTGATTAAIYVPLLNTGKETDRLIGASSLQAAKIEMHNEINDNGITKMRSMESIELIPGKPTTLQPHGMHLMVIGLQHPLKKGDMFPVTLQFEKSGSIGVMVMVQDTGDMAGHSGM